MGLLNEFIDKKEKGFDQATQVTMENVDGFKRLLQGFIERNLKVKRLLKSSDIERDRIKNDLADKFIIDFEIAKIEEELRNDFIERVLRIEESEKDPFRKKKFKNLGQDFADRVNKLKNFPWIQRI